MLISDFLGIVARPDAATIHTCCELAAALLPRSPEMVVAPASLPHLTLTQCALRDAPGERLAEFVSRLDEQLRGVTIP
jgi:hypothetical protein